MSRKTRRNAFHKAAKATDASSSVSALAKAGLSGFTLGSMAVSRSLFAADAAADASTAPTSRANEPQELQEVVVTGIRASLQRAMDIKMQAVGVVDAVSAEDIGQFPDASIGEALSRIPGVTVNRGSINAGNGATTATPNPTGITVRGFGTQFNEVLVEGRPVPWDLLVKDVPAEYRGIGIRICRHPPAASTALRSRTARSTNASSGSQVASAQGARHWPDHNGGRREQPVRRTRRRRGRREAPRRLLAAFSLVVRAARPRVFALLVVFYLMVVQAS